MGEWSSVYPDKERSSLYKRLSCSTPGNITFHSSSLLTFLWREYWTSSSSLEYANKVVQTLKSICLYCWIKYIQVHSSTLRNVECTLNTWTFLTRFPTDCIRGCSLSSYKTRHFWEQDYCWGIDYSDHLASFAWL